MIINWKTLGNLRSQLCCIIGLITFMGILMSFDGTTDMAGHLGGLFGGLTSGIAIFPGIQPKNKKFSFVGGGLLTAYMLAMLLVFYL
jgi:hypothetical protein